MYATATAPSPVEGWPLHHRPQAAGQARDLARAALARWRVPQDAADDIVVVVSELVANAVEHAAAPIALHLHREGAGCHIWIGVSDGGPAPAGREVRPRGEHGRGLVLVQALSQAHGVSAHAGGATRWARLIAA